MTFALRPYQTDVLARTLVIDLPLPPSVNKIWKQGGGKGVYRSPEYVAWRKHCDGLCMQYRWHKTPIKGPFCVAIVLDREKMRKGSDIDNRIKGLLDFLHGTGITDDDRYCEKVSAERGSAPSGCRVTITAATVAD